MSKWNRVRDSFHRSHDDFEFPSATLYTFSESYDNSADDMSLTRNEQGSFEAEFVPPSMDATVNEDGTSLGFDTSIRVKDTESLLSNIEVYGDDSQKASEIEIEGETYVVEGRRTEPGSGFELIRLSEA